MNLKNSEKGISLLLVVLISSVILSISLGISAILIKQTRIMESVGYSVIAFYAADTGVESALYDLYKSSSPTSCHSEESDNTTLGDAYYDTEAKCCHFSFEKCSFTDPENPPENPEDERPCPLGDVHIDSNCNALNFCLKSAGGYKTTKRAIEIRY